MHALVWLRHGLLACLLLTAMGLVVPALHAQAVTATLTDQARDTVREAAREVADIRRATEDIDSTETLRNLSERALAVQRTTSASVRALTPELERLDARIAQLGEVTEGTSEGRALAAQRRSLNAERAALDDLIRHGNLLSVEAGQLSEAIEKQRVQQFSQQLTHREASPLSPVLWQRVGARVDDDLKRLNSVLLQGRQAFSRAMTREGIWPLVAAVCVSLILVVPLRLLLRRWGQRFASSSRAPMGRLRRTGLAVWLVGIGTVLPTLSVWLVVTVLKAQDAVAPRLLLVADTLVSATGIAAFIVALSASLLAPNRPSWRLLPLDDIAASRLRKYAWMVAGLMWLALVVRALNRAARTNAITGVALDGVLALCYIGLILAILASLARLYRRQLDQALQTDDRQRAPAGTRRLPQQNGWTVLLRVGGYLSVISALLAALLGWINLSLFIVQQMLWLCVIGAALLLFLKFSDDFFTHLFAPESRVGKTIMLATGLSSSRLGQFGVLLSAVSRLVLVFAAVSAFALLQGNTTWVLGWMDTLRNGITIGGTEFRPVAVVRALLVMGIGLGVLQLLQRWLVDTYLPKTGLDAGGRNSISTVTRYAGFIVVALWTLTALGLGFEKLALVVSALSVGIGFGLQAITQNFISGLILLAERPVKIGDWVRIGDQEGDVRKISVRATEIQAGDKSTLIVPNSELITKTVRNMTLSNPLGRVQIKFQVPLSTDITALKSILLSLYAEHPGVQEEPSPTFYVDGIDGGMITINSYGHVGSPRNVYSIRSELLFSLLVALQAANIPLSTPTDIALARESR